MSTRLIITLVGVALLLLVGGQAVDSALVQSSTAKEIDGEAWDPDPGNWTELNFSNIDGAEYPATVKVYENDTQLDRGVDYDWNRSTGEVQALPGGQLQAGDNATIDYSYSMPTDTQRGIATVFVGVIDIGRGLLVLLGAALVLAAVGVLGRV